MVQKGLAPDVVSWSTTISACEKGAEWVLPFELLKEMRQWDLKPDVVSYSAAISACEKGAERLFPIELLSVMLQLHLKPNVISYNAAISACEKGQPALAGTPCIAAGDDTPVTHAGCSDLKCNH